METPLSTLMQTPESGGLSGSSQTPKPLSGNTASFEFDFRAHLDARLLQQFGRRLGGLHTGPDVPILADSALQIGNALPLSDAENLLLAARLSQSNPAPAMPSRISALDVDADTRRGAMVRQMAGGRLPVESGTPTGLQELFGDGPTGPANGNARVQPLFAAGSGEESLLSKSHAPNFAAGASAASAPVTTTQVMSAGAPQTNHIDLTLRDAGWSNAFASRVVWQVSEGIQHAQLHLNPPQLGPVEVRLQLSNDRTNVHFYVHDVGIKDAVQDALPRLREMLMESGMSLGDASVQHGASDPRQHGTLPHYTDAQAEPPPPAEVVMAATEMGHRLIDAYI